MSLNSKTSVLAIALFGWSALVLTAFAADPAAGKEIYATKCKTCHAADGQGNAGLAKALKVELKPLGSADIQGMSDADLAAVITKGKGKMKPLSLPASDVANVIAYVKTMKK